MPYKDKDEARKNSRKHYWNNRDEILESKKVVNLSEDTLAKIRIYSKEYYSRVESKIIRKKYTQREDVKQKQREYSRRPEVIQRTKERLKDPEVKKRNRLYRKSYGKKREVIEKRKEYIKKYMSKEESKNKKREYDRKYSQNEKYKLKKRDYYNLPRVRVAYRIRHRLRSVIKRYHESGKVMKSDKYGINFSEIINHLKPFPKNFNEYHIDHIRPICSFEFINDDNSLNLEEIKNAFAPKNLQWLTIKENLSKGGKWNGK